MLYAFLQKLIHLLTILEAHQGTAMVLLTIALVICAFASCWISSRSVRLMKKLDAKRSSPYVIIEATQNLPMYGVRLVNMGLTAARNVKVTATPKIEISFETFQKPIKFIEEGVTVLVPQGAYESILGTFDTLKQHNPSLVYRCTVSYESDWGEKFTTECVLDYSLYEGLAYHGTKTVHDLAKQFETFARDFHSLATGYYKPHILTEDYDKSNKKIEQMIEDFETKKTDDSTVAQVAEQEDEAEGARDDK